MSSPRAVVVGGGVAGLVAARDLARRGWAVELHEAASAFGGAIRASAMPDGLGGAAPIDLGAESFAVRGGTVAALIDELGLASAVRPPAPDSAWIVGEGRAAPLPAAGLLGIPQRPFARDVRRVIGVLGTVQTLRDRLSRLGPLEADESLGELVGRRLGPRVRDRLVDPIARGVYSRGASEVRLAELLPELVATGSPRSLTAAVAGVRQARPAGAAVAGLEGGMTRLVEALVGELDALGVRCELGSPRDPEALRAELVVDARSATRTEHTTAVIALLLDAPQLDAAPRGSGVLAVRRAPGSARALTHASAKWPWLAERLAPGRHLVRLSFDGAAPSAEHALAEASRLLGVELDPAQLVTSEAVVWSHPSVVSAEGGIARDGVLVVGGGASGPGIARVLAQTRRAVAEAVGE